MSDVRVRIDGELSIPVEDVDAILYGRIEGALLDGEHGWPAPIGRSIQEYHLPRGCYRALRREVLASGRKLAPDIQWCEGERILEALVPPEWPWDVLQHRQGIVVASGDLERILVGTVYAVGRQAVVIASASSGSRCTEVLRAEGIDAPTIALGDEPISDADVLVLAGPGVLGMQRIETECAQRGLVIWLGVEYQDPETLCGQLARLPAAWRYGIMTVRPDQTILRRLEWGFGAEIQKETS